MIRQKIVTQCSLIRLPGFPDNTVINYVFCPHVLSQNSDFFFPIPGLYFLSSSQKRSLISCYCNPGLIKSPDRTGGVWCGSRIMLSVHLSTQLLAVVLFSLITSCQYANKLPRLFSIPGLQCKIYDGNDDFFFLLPMHLFMGHKRVVCAGFFCCYFLLQAVVSSYVLTALYVSNYSLV